MSDRRRLQRSLFRMQMDAAFAQAVLAGQAEAVASTGLVDGDLALLRAVDPAALSADPGGKRRAQVLGNAASEFTLSLTAAAHRISDLLDAFPSAPEFHAAIAEDGRLPLAFAAYGIRRAAERDQRELLAVLELEAAMARLRRSSPCPHPRSIPSPHPTGEDRSSGAAVAVVGALVLAPTVRLHRAPRGTLAWTESLRTAFREGRAAPEAPSGLGREGSETILLQVAAARPHRLADVRVERLAPPADELLHKAHAPLTAAERARFARAQGASPEELEAFLESFLREGVLLPVG